MPDVNLLAILVTAIVVFVSGFTYYAVFGEQLAEVSDAAAAGEHPPPWKMAVEFSRGLILAAVIAGLASEAEIDEWTGGLLLGLALWIGFPFVLWAGAVIHESTPREARRHPRRRLAREAAAGRCDRERLAVTDASLRGARTLATFSFGNGIEKSGERRWACCRASGSENRPTARSLRPESTESPAPGVRIDRQRALRYWRQLALAHLHRGGSRPSRSGPCRNHAGQEEKRVSPDHSAPLRMERGTVE